MHFSRNKPCADKLHTALVHIALYGGSFDGIIGCRLQLQGQGCKSGEARATVEITDANPLSDYVKSYLSNRPENDIGDTSLEAIEAAITDRVEDAVTSELEEIMADGFAVVDTQLDASGNGTYKGDVVVTYMTPPAYVASQSKANVAVKVNLGFYSWEIEE